FSYILLLFLSVVCVFFFPLMVCTVIYPLSLHDALPILEVTLLKFTEVTVRFSFRVLFRLFRLLFVTVMVFPWMPLSEPPEPPPRSEEHTSELQSRFDLVCRLLLEKKNFFFYNM